MDKELFLKVLELCLLYCLYVDSESIEIIFFHLSFRTFILTHSYKFDFFSSNYFLLKGIKKKLTATNGEFFATDNVM